jgi:hypothetical protein
MIIRASLKKTISTQPWQCFRMLVMLQRVIREADEEETVEVAIQTSSKL